MELRDLTYFLACLDEGHLTRASRRLHVAQPTLSHALARLEAEAGERLLERPRTGRPRLSATPAGKLLAERARRAVAEVQAFSDDLAALRGVLRGEVRIGSMQTLNSTLVPKPLARFALDHPQVQMSLHTLAAEDIPAALAEGRIDVGLIAGAPTQVLGQLEARRLCSEELVAIMRHDDPLAKPRSLPLRRLADRAFVMVLPGTFTHGLIVEACRKAGFVPKVLLRLESGEAIREVVRAGLGLTVLPAGYLAERDPTLCAVRLTHPTPKRDVHVAWDERTRPSAATLAFVDALKRAAAG
ncbi:MAG: LysR family transcriptional regulator [Polyangiaceae bacterium]|nr:LysR family transcriptional regulator [Polyangiaceae bacterium]